MTKMTPKDFFLHMGAMVALYVSSISLITLLFQVINIAYPDQLDFAYYSPDPYSASIRWAIASIVIAFPIFLLLSWLLGRDYKRVPEKRSLGIRRWLVFITLFITGAAIAVDLIVLVNSFLGGEISTRFVWKVLAVLITAGFIFGYYIWDLRRSPETTANQPKIFAGIALLLVVASLVWGFVVMGSPTSQRSLRFDSQKVSDLENIQWRVVSRWQQTQALPKDVSELNDPISNFVVPIDPENSQSYEYRKVSNLEFELCANFDLANSSQNGNSAYPASPVAVGGLDNGSQDNWSHAAGRVCFDRTIDPALYPPVKK